MARAYARRLTSKTSLYNKEVTEKPTKKTKGGQKLTWHQIITRDLKTIDIDLQKAIKFSKDRDWYNEMVVDRVMAKAVNKFFLRMETLNKWNSPRTKTS